MPRGERDPDKDEASAAVFSAWRLAGGLAAVQVFYDLLEEGRIDLSSLNRRATSADHRCVMYIREMVRASVAVNKAVKASTETGSGSLDTPEHVVRSRAASYLQVNDASLTGRAAQALVSDHFELLRRKP